APRTRRRTSTGSAAPAGPAARASPSPSWTGTTSRVGASSTRLSVWDTASPPRPTPPRRICAPISGSPRAPAGGSARPPGPARAAVSRPAPAAPVAARGAAPAARPPVPTPRRRRGGPVPTPRRRATGRPAGDAVVGGVPPRRPADRRAGTDRRPRHARQGNVSTHPNGDHRPHRPRPGVPVERRTRRARLAAAVIALAVVATAAIVVTTGSAANSGFDPADTDQPEYGPTIEMPTSLRALWSHESTGAGAPLTTGGNLVTVDDDGELIGRDAGSGEEVWSYAHAGRLCAATYFSDSLVAAFDGAAGCSD